MYRFSIENSDSYVNQLLSITHEIYKSLDNSYEERVLSLDIFKAFERFSIWFFFINGSKTA